jgi:hypothetical protein
MEPGGRVTVLVEATSAEFVLRVRHMGIGIARKVLPFVVDPFVRRLEPGRHQLPLRAQVVPTEESAHLNREGGS